MTSLCCLSYSEMSISVLISGKLPLKLVFSSMLRDEHEREGIFFLKGEGESFPLTGANNYLKLNFNKQ